MNAPSNILSKVDRLRLRDGDECWLCRLPMEFEPAARPKKRATIEHLEAKSNGGTDALDNLCLCHPGCNRTLGARPKADKFKMRDKRRRKAAELPAPPAVRQPRQMAELVPDRHATSFAQWRTRAWASFTAATFFAGLALGQFLSR